MYHKEIKVNSPEKKEHRRSLRNNMTSAEVVLWQLLRGHKLGGYKFRRQQGIGPFILDFYCPRLKLCIEVDGDSHDYKYEYDEQRSLFLQKQGIKVIRFSNDQIFANVDWVINEIHRIVDERAPTPIPSP